MKKLSESSSFMFKSYLLRSNPIIEKAILKKYRSPLDYLLTQQGGSGRVITVRYNSDEFQFHEFEENCWALYDKDGRDCVTIGIDPEHHEAHINNINAETTKCGNTILTNQGSHLFKLSLKFLMKNKNKFGLQKITLKDNAQRYCPSSRRRIDLGVFLTLLTGHTWYGQYGFRPVDEDLRKDYRRNRDIMNKTRLRDVDFGVILRKLAEFKEERRVKPSQYDYFMTRYSEVKDTNPLIKDLLKHIFSKSNYSFTCSVFESIQPDLINLLGLRLFSQKQYVLALE